MNFKSILTVSAAATLLLASCAHEEAFEQENVEGLIPLNISSSINQVQTKATAQGFVDGDGLGLYAVNYSENNTVAGTLAVEGNQADNVKYVLDEANQKWSPVKSVYYKDVNTHVDLYLYYPYQSDITSVSEQTFEVKQDQSAAATTTALSGYEASDFLWGTATDVTPTESKIKVTLNHKMAGVDVVLKEGTGFDTDEFAGLAKSVIVMNTTRKATIDMSTGTVSPLGEAQLNGIVMCPQEKGDFRAIVVPQTVAASQKLLAITLGTTSYGFSNSAATAFQSGKMTQMEITVNKKTPAGQYELVLSGCQIVDWTEDNNTHGGEARQYYVVNVETPGTLEATINAAGKNPAKIKNLKITGQITSSDFTFIRSKMTILEALNLKEVRIVNAQSTSSTTSDLKDDIIPYSALSGKSTLYYFTFPEKVDEICEYAFHASGLSGALIIPDDVKSIGDYAFRSTNISSVSLPEGLKSIGKYAFNYCKSCSGELHLPSTVESIGNSAFEYCVFSGRLVLPKNLSYVATCAFDEAGSFTGDLVIPASLTKIYGSVFYRTKFSGSLIFEGEVGFGYSDGTLGAYGAFEDCGFTGELVIPEGVTTITSALFKGNNFSSIKLPSTLKTIGSTAFSGDGALMGNLEIPEGTVIIGSSAFYNCSHLQSLSLPSTLQTIQSSAFCYCYNLSALTCDAIDPPTVQSNAFGGVAKDNFTLEVPESSVVDYQTESGWSDFKRISAHYDFAISRSRLRLLNKGESRTYVLRVPSGFSWSISEKPDWVSVSPERGTGKTDVTVTISDMATTSETFEVNTGTFSSPTYKKYAGRKGDVVFMLDDKNYTSSLSVEQYNCTSSDGTVNTILKASKGNGIDIVFVGDGYDAKDIVDGTFDTNVTSGYEYFFNLEPYNTYKDYFNVYSVVSMSDDSGLETANTVLDTKFGSKLDSRLVPGKVDECFAWAKKADANMNLSKSLVIMLQNTSTYEGVTMMYTDGSAIACCPVSTEAYPYDFRGIIQHEAGGHGFGKLADEYIYHNSFIQSCGCIDDCEHPQSDSDAKTSYGIYKSLGWYKNLSMNADNKQVPWAHLIYNSQFSNYVDMFEGGYMHSRGIYRSESTSCMNNNIPYYSAISRQAIVERIMECAGETFSLEDFYAKDSRSVGTVTKGAFVVPGDRTYGVDPNFVRATGEGPILMGDHPNVK